MTHFVPYRRRDVFGRRPLIALQIEVTSRCTRRCEVCPRTPLASEWREGDLRDATWQRLRPDLSLARHVHFQGWGEPLLHPRLPEMVEAAGKAGCTVGLTTNGDVLSDAADWITTGDVERIAVSVAGDEATHAGLRRGSRLEAIWSAVRRLVSRRGTRKRPRVQIAYLLTTRNASELPRVVGAAARAGADEMFVTHLDCTPSRELAELAAFDASGLLPGVAEAVASAMRAARESGIAFRPPALVPRELLVCALDPLRIVFVGWDGSVGPCVNLMLPVGVRIQRWSRDGMTEVDPVVFGHLGELGLGPILAGERCRRFRAPFAARLAVEGRFRSAVAGEPASRVVRPVSQGRRLVNPPPWTPRARPLLYPREENRSGSTRARSRRFVFRGGGHGRYRNVTSPGGTAGG
jgi:MoaA/NifB/PqqE/SkfB family radical SAM enzyme